MEDCTLEEQLLLHAKEGNCPQVQRLLQSRIHQNSSLNINCRSRSKTCSGWTPLHLACSFGHRDVVEELLKAGADVNLQNNLGDTPLHKAAYAGRKEIVLLLLRYDACANIINGTAQIPKDVTEDDEIITMLEAAERRAARRHEEKLLEAAREGAISTLSKLLNGKDAPDIHCRDSVGNTPLHCAAYRGQKQCVIKLLKCGANPSIKNNNGISLILLFNAVHKTDISFFLKDMSSVVQKIEGPLWKSSRFLGWRSHWVVVENGTVSWYPRQADALAGVRKQGCKSLSQAYCMVKPWDHCFFMLRCFDDSVHYFKVPSQTNAVATRKRWLDAFEEHASYCTRHDTEEVIIDYAAGDVRVRNLEQALQVRPGSKSKQKLESEVSTFLSMAKNEENYGKCFRHIQLLLCRDILGLWARSLRSLLTFCLVVLCLQVWSLKVEQEVEKNKALTEALQTLATENHELKQSLSKRRKSSNLSTLNEDDFYDAVSGQRPLGGSNQSIAYRGPSGMSGEGNHGNQPSQHNGVKHRTSLPAPMFSRNDVSIWSILKKCIGMELSKIAMPVVFNEPLSFLQRLTEYMEHTYLIHQANATTDSIERMKCVAAFAVSAVASQWERTGKPFNPLLGETYELIRDDLGFRWMSEQVSHHPPVSAFHAEGLKEDFVFHGSIYPKLKFWGKSIEAEPKGVITLELPKYNEAYTWTNPTCCVHNIIVGQLWIEQYGSVEVLNHKTGERCSMTFKPCGLFGKELHKVEGYILDKSKKKLCAIYGKWTECLYTVDPATFDAHKKTEKKNPDEKKGNKQSTSEQTGPDCSRVIPGSELIWKITPRPENSSKFYAFSTFAMQLNELDKRMEGVIPSTDSRLRPDICAMEKGDIDLASAEKKRLEEKQRMARKNRTKSTEEWKVRNAALGPRWFQQGPNPHNKAQDWLYLKGYWDRNYSQLPDIY
uniref:Oxysterol-binding protein n=1 Tax=Astatotilapia calliptera TaxID=8154 RepID=A0AAX7TMW0_ASTCA